MKGFFCLGEKICVCLRTCVCTWKVCTLVGFLFLFYERKSYFLSKMLFFSPSINYFVASHSQNISVRWRGVRKLLKPILKFSTENYFFCSLSLKYIYGHNQVFQPPMNTFALSCPYSPCPFLSSNFQLCLVCWVPLLIHHTFQPSYLYHCSL